MNYQEILESARKNMNGNCKACPVCNGEACRGVLPGPGGLGSGDAFVRSFKKLEEVKVHLDTFYKQEPIRSEIELFGRTFKAPFFSAPVATLSMQYGEKYTAFEYAVSVVKKCAEDGIAAFIYDDPAVLDEFAEEYRQGGLFIPTVKPWPVDVMKISFKRAEDMGAMAVATDLDGAGLPMVQGGAVPVGPKSVEEVSELVESVNIPVLIKGIMTPAGAKKAVQAGAYGIVVSNHGGRVQDQTPAPIEMLPEIVEAVQGKIKIFVDGGVRTGIDVFKCLALGADAALICRPYPIMYYGAHEEGISFYNAKVIKELHDTMKMTASPKLSDIDRSKVLVPWQ